MSPTAPGEAVHRSLLATEGTTPDVNGTAPRLPEFTANRGAVSLRSPASGWPSGIRDVLFCRRMNRRWPHADRLHTRLDALWYPRSRRHRSVRVHHDGL